MIWAIFTTYCIGVQFRIFYVDCNNVDIQHESINSTEQKASATLVSGKMDYSIILIYYFIIILSCFIIILVATSFLLVLISVYFILFILYFKFNNENHAHSRMKI